MSVTPRVSTPVSVGRFVASIRSVAASSDGLVMCTGCRRQMSDMAETCPHCSTVVTDRVVAAAPVLADVVERSTSTRLSGGDIRSISVMVLSLAIAAYVVLRVAGL